MFFKREELIKWKEKCRHDVFFSAAFEKMCEEAGKMDADWLENRRGEIDHFRERARVNGGGKIMRYGNEMRALTVSLMKLTVFDTIMEWGRTEIIIGLLELILRDPWLFQGQLEGWKSDLWTADVGVGTAVSWELIQDRLSTEKNAEIKKAILEQGILPIYEEWVNPQTRIHALDTMGHNWWSVCVAGAGTMLFIIDDAAIPDNRQMMHQIVESLQEWFDYDGNIGLNKHPNFGEKGDYREYIGYMVFGMAHFSIFYTLLKQRKEENVLHVDDILRKIPDFFMDNMLRTPEGLRCADFGDNHLCTTPMHFLYFLCNRFEREDMLEALNGMYIPQNPCELFFYPTGLKQKMRSLPLISVYQNSGHAVLREERAKNDIAFIMKTGESWNHNHLDVGTFELSVNGEKCITDSGTCSYSNPLYHSYYIQPFAHNTITFDGCGQWPEEQYEGTKYPGRYVSWIAQEEYKYLLADCTGPYLHTLQRYYRHVILTGGRLILVDDVEAYRDGSVETYFHGNGKMLAEKDGIHICTGRQKLKLVFPFLTQEDMILKKGYLHTKGEGADGKEILEQQDYVTCTYRTSNNRTKCVTVILPQQAAAKVTAGGNPDVLDLWITEGEMQERYLINCRADGSVMHKNGWISYDGIETDAFLTGFFYERAGQLRAYSLHNGSKLKSQGKVLYSSNRKEDYYGRAESLQ